MKILIIEDDQNISEIIKSTFEDEKNQIFQEEDWEKWLKKVTSQKFDLVILDLNLPSMDWVDVCKNIRQNRIYWKTPIIMLTARLSIDSKIDWLEAWADDYISKPFDLRELKLRAETLISRAKNQKEILEFKDLEIDLDAKKTSKILDWKKIKYEMSPKEVELLKYLLDNIWEIKSPEEIYQNVWWENPEQNPSFLPNLKFFIAELRQKTFKNFIKNKSKVGFYINTEEFWL